MAAASDPLALLGRAASGLSLRSLPAEAVQRARQRVLDTIEIRFGRTLFPSANYVGWWTPGLLGALGAAVNASHLLGLTAEGIDNTIGIVLRITKNEDYERQYPARSLARVTLRLRNGKSYSQESDRSANPRYLTPTDADMESKFRRIAPPILGQARTDRVVKLVQNLETLPDTSELIAALRLPAA